MHLLGSVMFVAAAVLLLLVVWVRVRTDRGMRERRALTDRGAEVWEWFAAFEKDGGRVQDLEGLPFSDDLRVRSLHWRAAGQAGLVLAIAAVCFALGWWWWVPLGIILAIVVAGGFWAEWLSFLADDTAQTWRYGQDTLALAGGLVLKGIVLCGGVGLVWVAAALVADRSILLAIVAAVAGAVLIDRSHVPARWVESAVRAGHQAEFAEHTGAETVLYLRSFDDDSALVYAPVASKGWYAPLVPQRVRFEELLETWTFRNAGHVVAIGRPGERRPSLGAQRTYWTDESWQEAVRRTAARCKAIILVAGVTEGLGWEISTLAAMGVLGKTLLLLPPDTPENTRLRYERIVAATGRSDDVRIEGRLELGAVPALGYTPDGALVHYVSFGRDWAAFVLAEMHLLMTLSGRGRFEDAGNLTRMMELSDDPVVRARMAALRMHDTDLALAILDGAADPADEVRVRIARAAVVLAASGDRGRAADCLSTAAVAGATPDRSGAADADLILQARRMLDAPQTAPEDLFRLILPGELLETDRPRRHESLPVGVRVRLMRLWSAASRLQDAGRHEAALAKARSASAVAAQGGFTLAGAQSDALLAEELSALSRDDEAAALARDILARDLPDALKIGTLELTAGDVKDYAAGVLLDAVPPSTASNRQEHVRVLEDQHARRLADGLRAEAAATAQRLALYHVEGGDAAQARHWGRTALDEFVALGLPGDQAQTLITLARAALGAGGFDEAAERGRQARALIEANGFATLRSDALYLAALAAHGLAPAAADASLHEAAVAAIGECLAHGEAEGFPGDREPELLDRLAAQLRALGRASEADDARRRALASRERR